MIKIQRYLHCHFLLAKQHQDATYTITEPVNVIGFGIPLEDAPINTSCIWVKKGSHKTGLLNR